MSEVVKDIIGALPDAGKIVDNVTTTEEEVMKEGTKRLQIDNASPFRLPAFVRPILSFYYSLLFGYILIYGIHKGVINIDDALLTLGGIVTAIIAFYFSWRGAQKISADKNKAAIKIIEMQTKADIKTKRREARRERKGN